MVNNVICRYSPQFNFFLSLVHIIARMKNLVQKILSHLHLMVEKNFKKKI